MSLSERDYLRVRQAAEYAGISISHWRARIQREFPPAVFYGKLLYRKVDVQRFIESKAKWPQPLPDGRVRASKGSRNGSPENRLVALHGMRMKDSGG